MARVHGGSRWPADWIVDATFALVLAVTNALNMYFPESASAYAYPPPNPVQLFLGTCACFMFSVRQRIPLSTLVVSLTAAGIIAGSGWNAGFLPYALVLALYTVGAHKPLPWAIAGLAATQVTVAVLAFLDAPYFQDAYVVLTFAWYAAAWAAGLLMRRVREDRDRERERALQAERNKALAAAEARVQERLSIARDMHDVVAHTLSVMIMQAGLARLLLPARPDEAAQAIERAEVSARGATQDLRRMLGVLRTETTPAEFGPAPGIVDLIRLTEGDNVDLDMSGHVDALPASVRLTVYRIVQEGLTNVRKHAPDSRVKVRVAEEGGSVDVQVTNEPGPHPTGRVDEGWGLVGLLERIEMYGGTFSAAPTANGGFDLRASL